MREHNSDISAFVNKTSTVNSFIWPGAKTKRDEDSISSFARILLQLFKQHSR